MAVVPPGGGWRFQQRLPNGGYKTFICNSPDLLREEVLQFRINAGMPTDTLTDELKAGMSLPVRANIVESRSLRERVTAWLVNKQFGTIKYVTPEEANERAKLASQDPYNVVDYADSCIECFNSTLRGLVAIRQGRTTPYDAQLGACSHCGWDNRTVVHLQAESLNLTGAAKPCWCSMLDTTPVKELE